MVRDGACMVFSSGEDIFWFFRCTYGIWVRCKYFSDNSIGFIYGKNWSLDPSLAWCIILGHLWLYVRVDTICCGPSVRHPVIIDY